MLKFIYIIILAVVAFFLQSCFVSNKTSKFDFAQDADFGSQANVISVNVPTFLAKSYLKKSLRNDGESEDIINLVKKVKDVKVLVVENSNASSKANFQKFVNQKNLQEWVSIKKESQVISILADQSSNEVVKRLIISINDNNRDLVFVDVKGNFSTDDISKIINATENNQIKIKIK